MSEGGRWKSIQGIPNTIIFPDCRFCYIVSRSGIFFISGWDLFSFLFFSLKIP